MLTNGFLSYLLSFGMWKLCNFAWNVSFIAFVIFGGFDKQYMKLFVFNTNSWFWKEKE